MVSEFEFIDNIKSTYGLDKIGDDCAVLPKDSESDLLLTADMLVEDIDFRLDWITPELLGQKVLAVSLSDVAAMGGTPKWGMLSIAVGENLWNTGFLDRFYQGWMSSAYQYQVDLIGGDVSRSPDGLAIDSIVGGEVPKAKAIRRSTAKPGDAIFISGTIGGAAGGLRLLENGHRYDENFSHPGKDLLVKQLKPEPQIELAKRLQTHAVVTSMIDLSDGLSSDLAHLCQASGVGATVDAAALPLHGGLTSHFPPNECLLMALDGGEDFELLFTVEEKNISLLDTFDVSRIGTITPTVDIIELIGDGESVILVPRGYRHF